METAGQEVAALSRQPTVLSPVRQPQHYLGVRLEGDVATEDVVEEDAQGPDCQTVSRVASVLDPLWRSVDPGTWNNNIANIANTSTSYAGLA